jgi:hypothetical protein
VFQNLIPSNKVGVEAKRPSRPLNITPLSKLSAVIQNNVVVYWTLDSTHNYCVGVYLVRQLTSSDLLSRLKQNGIRHQDHTRALIKEKLTQNIDSEISTTSLRISLLCPLSKQRMVVPCRPSSCSHLQCFDASTFLQMNEKKTTWTCPVCNKPAEYSSLVIDGLFTEILAAAVGCHDIQFTASGQWTTVEQTKSVAAEPINSDTTAVVIDATQESPCRSDRVELIDLTEDSDDDAASVLSCVSSESTISLDGFPSTRCRRASRLLSSSSSVSAAATAAATSGSTTPTDDDTSMPDIIELD